MLPRLASIALEGGCRCHRLLQSAVRASAPETSPVRGFSSVSLLNDRRQSSLLASCSQPAFLGRSQLPQGGDSGLPFSFAKRGFIDQIFDTKKFMQPDVYDPNQRSVFNLITSLDGQVLGQPYRPPPPVSSNPFANNNAGWRRLDASLRRFLHMNFTVLWRCHRSINGFNSQQLRWGAMATYRQVNSAIASGKLAVIKPYVTEVVYKELQVAASAAKKAGRIKQHVVWGLAAEPRLEDVQLVDGNISEPLRMSQFTSKLRFVQVTVRVETQQIYAVYEDSSRSKLLAGDPDKPIRVVDYWVFERPVIWSWIVPRSGPLGPEGEPVTWRLAARLDVTQALPTGVATA